MSGRVSVPCWLATPVANAPWKPLIIRWRSSSVQRSWKWWKVWSVGKSLLVKGQNVISHSREGYSILLNKIPVSTIKLPEWRFQAFQADPGVRKGKRSLLASHTRCKCSMETTHNSVKVKLGTKVVKLVESLIGREVTVGQGSECHLTFVRGLLHIAQ